MHQHRRRVGAGPTTVCVHLVCWECRYTAKALTNERKNRRCPKCQHSLVDCGKFFKTPKKRDNRRWRLAKILYWWARPQNNSFLFKDSNGNVHEM